MADQQRRQLHPLIKHEVRTVCCSFAGQCSRSWDGYALPAPTAVQLVKRWPQWDSRCLRLYLECFAKLLVITHALASDQRAADRKRLRALARGHFAALRDSLVALHCPTHCFRTVQCKRSASPTPTLPRSGALIGSQGHPADQADNVSTGAPLGAHVVRLMRPSNSQAHQSDLRQLVREVRSPQPRGRAAAMSPFPRLDPCWLHPRRAACAQADALLAVWGGSAFAKSVPEP